jgi:hypothetical protein
MLKDKLLTPFNGIFLIVTLVYGGSIWILTQIYNAPAYFTTSFYSITLHWATVFFMVLFVAYRVFSVMIVDRPVRLTRAIIADIKGYITWERFLNVAPLLVLIPVFFSLFTSAKNLIPVINPFSWDPVFADLDAFLHFGRQPWEWLMPVLGFAGVTMVISLFYKLWFIIKFFVMYWQAFSLSRPALRERFFIALLGIWIINGTVLAMWLSSAGPCFFAQLYPDLANPYAGLMEYLYAANDQAAVFDLPAQEFLWQAYQGHAPVPFSGISAMPSMHVSLAFLFLLLGWNYGRAQKIFFSLFLACTIIGSIHLGWHYAADGYLSILTTLPIWWAAGKIVALYRKE